MRKNYFLVVLILISIVLGFYVGSIYKNNKYQDNFYLVMINDVYKSSSVVNSYLSDVGEWDGYDNQKLNKQMSRVIMDISVLQNNVDYFLHNSYYDNSNNFAFIQDFSKSLTLLNYIISEGLNFNNDFISNDFLEDGVLNSNEIEFLQAMQEEFEYIENSMDDLGRENNGDGINYDELRNSLERFTYRYSDKNINNLKVLN
jgi:hypothetical protein